MPRVSSPSPYGSRNRRGGDRASQHDRGGGGSDDRRRLARSVAAAKGTPPVGGEGRREGGERAYGTPTIPTIRTCTRFRAGPAAPLTITGCLNRCAEQHP